MSTDALVLLKADHKEVKRLFREFHGAGAGATKTKGDLVAKIIELLTVHTYIENEVMYPEVRRLLPDLEDEVLESYEEHHVADVLCMELFAMPADAERFDAKTTLGHCSPTQDVPTWASKDSPVRHQLRRTPGRRASRANPPAVHGA